MGPFVNGGPLSIRCESGPAAVVGSGETTTFGGHPLRLVLDMDDTEAITVELRFRSDDSQEEASVQSVPMDDGIALELVNFDGVDGRGTSLPALLAEVGPDLVFLHFRIFRWGRTPDRTVHWTFYRVPKDAVSWTPAETDVEA